MMLITLEQAKKHIYVDHDYDDADITLKIQAASGAVLNYLKGAPIGEPERDEQGRIQKDSNGVVVYQYDSNGLVISSQIKSAVCLLVAEFYKNRAAEQDGEVSGQFGYGYLPRPVMALLYPLRDPALA